MAYDEEEETAWYNLDHYEEIEDCFKTPKPKLGSSSSGRISDSHSEGGSSILPGPAKKSNG